jgi:hypothetical protein
MPLTTGTQPHHLHRFLLIVQKLNNIALNHSYLAQLLRSIKNPILAIAQLQFSTRPLTVKPNPSGTLGGRFYGKQNRLERGPVLQRHHALPLPFSRPLSVGPVHAAEETCVNPCKGDLGLRLGVGLCLVVATTAFDGETTR